MQLFFLFSYGMLATLLELHLDSFGVSHFVVTATFIMHSLVYLVISLSAGKVFAGIDERTLMFIGALALCLAYIMMGPWSLIFPNELGLVLAGIPVLAFGESLTYSIIYVVFSIPFMVKSATTKYGYANDDILNDVISSFGVIFGALGEITGSLYAGFAADLIGIENTFTYAGALNFIFAVVFFLGTDMIGEVLCKKHKKSLLVVPDKTQE